MAKMTLLAMAQMAMGEMGQPQPSTLFNAADNTAAQLLSLANREGREAARMQNGNGGWQELRKENTWVVQSTGMIPSCSYTLNSNVITIGTPATQAPQVGWTIATGGGSNATGFPYPTKVTAVNGNQITVSNVATMSNSNVSMAFGQEAYSLPADLDYIIPGTLWDRGYRWQIYGPLTPQEWQTLKSGLSPTGPRRRYRLISGSFYIDPIPYDSNTLVYEYYSTNFALTGGVTAASSFTTDSDTFVLPDDVLIFGLKWRYLRAKGLDYAEEFKSYDDAVGRELGRDGVSQVLALDVMQPDVRLLTQNQIPDTGFGT